jgi:hypothetical protein
MTQERRSFVYYWLTTLALTLVVGGVLLFGGVLVMLVLDLALQHLGAPVVGAISLLLVFLLVVTILAISRWYNAQ